MHKDNPWRLAATASLTRTIDLERMSQGEGVEVVDALLRAEEERLRSSYAKASTRPPQKELVRDAQARLIPTATGAKPRRQKTELQAQLYRSVLNLKGDMEPVAVPALADRAVEDGVVEDSKERIGRIWHIVKSLERNGWLTLEGQRPKMKVRLTQPVEESI